jgi:hypothetical protein
LRETAFRLTETAITEAQGKFYGLLRRRRIEYFAKREWSNGNPHLHLVLIAPGGLDTADVGDLWRKALPAGTRATHYCEPIRDPEGLAHYLGKHRGVAPELPPEGFKGKLHTASRGFLVRPTKVLWREQLAAGGYRDSDGDGHDAPAQTARGDGPLGRVAMAGAKRSVLETSAGADAAAVPPSAAAATFPAPPGPVEPSSQAGACGSLQVPEDKVEAIEPAGPRPGAAVPPEKARCGPRKRGGLETATSPRPPKRRPHRGASSSPTSSSALAAGRQPPRRGGASRSESKDDDAHKKVDAR